MPTKGAEYALLQKKYKFENVLEQLSSHRSRAREKERYLRASQRNELEQQRNNLRDGMDRLPEPLQQYYGLQIKELEAGIKANKNVFLCFEPTMTWNIKNLTC